MEEIRLTTCDIWNPMNSGIFSISTGAGLLPSPVGPRFSNKITHWAARGFSKCKYFIPIKPYGLTLQSAWISEGFSRVFPILHAISLAHMGCTSLTFLFSKRNISSTNWPSCSASFQCARHQHALSKMSSLKNRTRTGRLSSLKKTPNVEDEFKKTTKRGI